MIPNSFKLRIGVILFALNLCASALADEAPKKSKPKFTISKETTFITEPVDKDGYIDYAAALNQRLSKGVTSENNANVLIWKAIGPRPVGKPVPPQFFRLLGIDEPPEKGEYFVSADKYSKETLKEKFDWPVGPAGPGLAGPELDVPVRKLTFNDRVGESSRRPWTAKEYPDVAAWLKANEKPLATVIQATKRDRYFSPKIRLSDENGVTYYSSGALQPNHQSFRYFVEALCCRAMQSLGDGKHQSAWEDLLAAHRLTRLLGQCASFVETLAALSLDMRLAKAYVVFLSNTTEGVPETAKCLNELLTLKPFPDIGDKADLAERFEVLENVIRVARTKDATILEFSLFLAHDDLGKALDRGLSKEKPNQQTAALLDDIEWDSILQRCNDWNSRIVTALQKPQRQLREKDIQALKEESDKLKKNAAKGR